MLVKLTTDELFDSEDGDATTMSSENLTTSAVKSLPSLASSKLNNIDVVKDEESNDESSPSMNFFFETGNIVTSSSSSGPQSSGVNFLLAAFFILQSV